MFPHTLREVGIRICFEHLLIQPPGRLGIAEGALHLGEGVVSALRHGFVAVLFDDLPIPHRRRIRTTDGEEEHVGEFVPGHGPPRAHPGLRERVPGNAGEVDGGQFRRHALHARRPFGFRLGLLGHLALPPDRIEPPPVGHVRAVAPLVDEVRPRFLKPNRIPVIEEAGIAPGARRVDAGNDLPFGQPLRLWIEVLLIARALPETLFDLPGLAQTAAFLELPGALFPQFEDARIERLRIEAAQLQQGVHARDLPIDARVAGKLIFHLLSVENGFRGKLVRVELGGAPHASPRARAARTDGDRGGVEVGGGAHVVPEIIAIEFAEGIMDASFHVGRIHRRIVIIEQIEVAFARVLAAPHGLIDPPAQIRQFGAIAVVLVVPLHLPKHLQRRFPIAVEPLDADGAVLGGIGQFVERIVLLDAFVGGDGILIPPHRLVNLAEQKLRTGGDVLIGRSLQPLFQFRSRRLPVGPFDVEFSQREVKHRGPLLVQPFPRQAHLQMRRRLVVSLARDERARQPEMRLVLQIRLQIDHFLEFLFGSDVVLLIKIGFADQQQRVIDPLRVRVFAQHVGAFLDGVLEVLRFRGAVRIGEDRQVQIPIDRFLVAPEGLHAPVERLPRIIEGIVIGGEIVEAAAHERVAAAAGQHQHQTQETEAATHHGRLCCGMSSRTDGGAPGMRRRAAQRNLVNPYQCLMHNPSRDDACPA